jgi:hypothetical protein
MCMSFLIDINFPLSTDPIKIEINLSSDQNSGRWEYR